LWSGPPRKDSFSAVERQFIGEFGAVEALGRDAVTVKQS
jgi:hypothetical protein